MLKTRVGAADVDGMLVNLERKLWLDDLRPAPEGWLRAFSVEEAWGYMRTYTVTHASLDHDLGDYEREGGDGIKLIDRMIEHGVWPTEGLRVHSANPVGVQNMSQAVQRHGPYSWPRGAQFGAAPDGGWPPAIMCL